MKQEKDELRNRLGKGANPIASPLKENFNEFDTIDAVPICNLCGSSDWTDMNRRKGVKCAVCSSLERTRALGLYLETFSVGPDTRTLFIAPDKGLHDIISMKVHPENYVPADFDTARYKFLDRCEFIDLCALDEWDSDSFDLIIHLHVLEHTPCNIAYTLFHLDRMLSKDGVHLCVIPFMNGTWDEAMNGPTEEERTARFGQFDHVRRFGAADVPDHLGKIVKLPEYPSMLNDFPEEILTRHNIPSVFWEGFNGSTVLRFAKGDYLLK